MRAMPKPEAFKKWRAFGLTMNWIDLRPSDCDIQNHIHRSAVWEMTYVGVESMPFRNSALRHHANVKTVQWLSDGSQATSNMAHNVKLVGGWLPNPEFNLEGKINVGKMYRRRHTWHSQFTQKGHTRT